MPRDASGLKMNIFNLPPEVQQQWYRLVRDKWKVAFPGAHKN